VIVRFLKNVEPEVKSTRTCGDGCCTYDEWNKDWFPAGTEVEAIPFKENFVLNGTVCLEGLTFKQDYEIIAFP